MYKSISFNGFTLIELIIVIVILGTLAIVAAPRFINIQSDAKVAVFENIAGQIRSAATLIEIKSKIPGSTIEDGGNTFVELDGGRRFRIINDFLYAGEYCHAIGLTNASLNVNGSSFSEDGRFRCIYNNSQNFAIRYRNADGSSSNQCQLALNPRGHNQKPSFSINSTGC